MDLIKALTNYTKKDNSLKKNSKTDNKNILLMLKSLGKLPKNFKDDAILPLLFYKNQDIRFWAVKTLGKAKNKKNLTILEKIAWQDCSTEVRREAVSSIGRLRTKIAIPALFKFLKESDPKIVLQAIRGLLVFKEEAKVHLQLQKLLKHPNETVQNFIKREYCIQKNKKISNKNQSHEDSYDFLKNVIVLGDVRKILKVTPDESFHLTFTSPPYYNARDYSIYKSYMEYLIFLEEVFLLVYQKTKEGRFLIVNTSPIILPRVSRQHSSKRYPIPFDLHHFLIKMGWEFIDDIIWEKPESSVKNRNAGFLQHRKPLAYKPNPVTEYLMVYRKKTERLLDWNIRQYDQRTVKDSKVKDGYETSNVWKIDPKYNKVHSAVFPLQLCQRVIDYYSFKGDLVFDPFAGSGTFGRVAKNLNRFFFLAEKEKKYFDYMKTFFLENRDLFENHKFMSQFLTLNEYKRVVKK